MPDSEPQTCILCERALSEACGLPPEPSPDAVRCECIGEDGARCDHEPISREGLAFVRDYEPTTPDPLAGILRRMHHSDPEQARTVPMRIGVAPRFLR